MPVIAFRSVVFRQAALDRLSSPEQLDKLVSLTPPAEWLALLVACGLIVAAIVWGVTGSIDTDVNGAGILVVGNGAIVDAVSSAAGRLSSVSVQVDQSVVRGQLLARLEQIDTEHHWHDAQAVLEERKRDYQHLAADNANDLGVREKSYAQQTAALSEVTTAAKQRANFLASLITAIDPLVDRGMVTRTQYWDFRNQKAVADQQVSQVSTDLLKLDAQRQEMIIAQNRALTEADQRVSEAQRQVDTLAAEFARNSEVLSPVDGRVTEIKVAEGAVLAAGLPVLSIERAGGGLEVVAFVPPDEGKMVRPGMTARIAPTTAHKEEVGTLVGTVLDVSDFPASAQGMRALLQNDRLVERFSARGAPYIVRLALEHDPAAPSGYRWSSGEGPSLRLASGTLAQVQVTVRQQPPISLVIPTLRQLSGIYE